MTQIDLLGRTVAPVPPSADLRCASVDDVVASLAPGTASLLYTDPPWSYNAGQKSGTGGAGDQYDVLGMEQIAMSINAAYDKASRDCYLLLWCTSPHLRPWFLTEARVGFRWTYLSCGVWGKTGPETGIGYHWRGKAEYLLLYRKGAPKPANLNLPNLHLAPRGEHSEKPAAWLAELVASFCPAGGTVLDLYAGLAPMASACVATGRRYIGAEIDPERHARALGLVAHRRLAWLGSGGLTGGRIG